MPCLLQIFGPIVVLSLVITAPESPRWMVSKGKMEEAKAMIVKHHANGKEDDPLALWEYNEIVTTMQQELTSDKSRYIDFFRTKGNRKRLWVTVFLGMASNWVGNGILGCECHSSLPFFFSSFFLLFSPPFFLLFSPPFFFSSLFLFSSLYTFARSSRQRYRLLIADYLAPVLNNVGITDPLTITGLNAALAGWNMIVSLSLGAHSEKMGRRFMWITSNAGMGFGFAFIMGFAAAFANTGRSSFGLAVIPFIFIVYAFYDLAYICLNYTFVAEFMPYNLRTKGLAIYITWNNISNAFNQYVM